MRKFTTLYQMKLQTKEDNFRALRFARKRYKLIRKESLWKVYRLKLFYLPAITCLILGLVMTLWSLIPSLGEDTWLWHFRETFYVCGPIICLAGVFWITSVHLVIVYRIERFEKERKTNGRHNEENPLFSLKSSENVELTKITYRRPDEGIHNGTIETDSNFNLAIEPNEELQKDNQSESNCFNTRNTQEPPKYECSEYDDNDTKYTIE